jgi:hypothetical protein
MLGEGEFAALFCEAMMRRGDSLDYARGLLEFMWTAAECEEPTPFSGLGI